MNIQQQLCHFYLQDTDKDPKKGIINVSCWNLGRSRGVMGQAVVDCLMLLAWSDRQKL